ncbi:hypothetical protein [Roseimicrobium sp. ORNL1]|uniref:hypothetical protein n=1 Tax=Roseimicrobium sp. ORNL1 TaxID=2711231 RepID=UPI0013E12365|nr:hypothetical protein [Roseimicrobium sp. ORNL1]QIF01993.1 hypothetical protein G5S37_10770 [Roseimicrobium sp. ORNL1]
MSRRAKLFIASIFIMLLAVLGWQFVSAWRPENPLRFRHVGGNMERGPFEEGYYQSMQMELRNTSGVDVMLISGTFREELESKGEGLLSSAHVGRRGIEAFTVPARGTLMVDFYCSTTVSVDAFKSMQSEKWQARKGSVHYEWVSRSKARAVQAHDWLHRTLPAGLAKLLPELSPFSDTTTVEP